MCQLLPFSLPRSLVSRHLVRGEGRFLLAGAPLAEGYARISTTAWLGQGRSVLLPTWHSPSFFVASVFRRSSTTTVRVLGAGNAGAAKSTTPNDAAGTVS